MVLMVIVRFLKKWSFFYYLYYLEIPRFFMEMVKGSIGKFYNIHKINCDNSLNRSA